MVTASRPGLMAPPISANGHITLLMVRVSFATQMEIYTKETGLTTKLKGGESIHILTMVRFMKDFGNKMCNMEKGKKRGQMVPALKVNTGLGRSQASANIRGQTSRPSQVTG
jgi:hypothetical protein